VKIAILFIVFSHIYVFYNKIKLFPFLNYDMFSSTKKLSGPYLIVFAKDLDGTKKIYLDKSTLPFKHVTGQKKLIRSFKKISPEQVLRMWMQNAPDTVTELSFEWVSDPWSGADLNLTHASYRVLARVTRE